MVLTITKAYRVNISTEVEVPDEDYKAGIDYSDLVEKCSDELDLAGGISIADVSGCDIIVTNEEGVEVFLDEDC